MGKKLLDDSIYFLIKGMINIRLGYDKNSKNVFLKFDNINDIIDFLDNFEKNIDFDLVE